MRFWSKVTMATTGCWLWTAATNDFGYGIFMSDRSGGWRAERAHRLMFNAAHGEIPGRMVVCHRCDVPACVNPAHLFLGTKGDNTSDMMLKNRHRVRPLLGEAHGCHRLTEEAVLEIRRLYSTGEFTQVALGRMFGVQNTQIHHIVSGKQWRHI